MTDPKTKYFEFELRRAQKVAFGELQAFVKSNSQKVFILKGYAGTGKTTLMSGFISWMAENNHSYSLLASTGRAAKILSDKTDNEASTIHSLIYIFSDLDDDLETMAAKQENLAVDDKGQISLIFDAKVIDSKTQKIYIVDEASMVADVPDTGGSFAKFGTGELLRDLLAYDAKGKFVFVGDPCQLPPVGQHISPALSKEYIEKKYHLNTRQFELTEIIRQAATKKRFTAMRLPATRRRAANGTRFSCISRIKYMEYPSLAFTSGCTQPLHVRKILCMWLTTGLLNKII